MYRARISWPVKVGKYQLPYKSLGRSLVTLIVSPPSLVVTQAEKTHSKTKPSGVLRPQLGDHSVFLEVLDVRSFLAQSKDFKNWTTTLNHLMMVLALTSVANSPG